MKITIPSQEKTHTLTNTHIHTYTYTTQLTQNDLSQKQQNSTQAKLDICQTPVSRLFRATFQNV